MESATAGRIKARASELQFNARSHPVNQRHEAACQKIKRRSQRIMRPAFKRKSAPARSREKRGQHGLQDQRGTARGAHRKTVITWSHRARSKLQRLRVQFCPG